MRNSVKVCAWPAVIWLPSSTNPVNGFVTWCFKLNHGFCFVALAQTCDFAAYKRYIRHIWHIYVK